MSKLKVAFTAGILFPQIFLFGCSKGDSANNGLSQEVQPQYLESSSESEAKATAQNGRVYCASTDPADCSPSVGMLVSFTAPSTVAQCTAFLVSPQIAITNSHCVPQDLKSAGSDCSNRIWLYFPELNGLSQIRTGCSQVIEASTLPEATKAVPDYAVIRLDQAVNRPPLGISRDGFKDENAYQIVKIDPQSTTSAVGAMTRATCKALHNSIIVPHSNDDESFNMAMGDCEIVHGNSGSPLIDPQGKVHGVIQLTFEQNTLGSAIFQLSLPMLDTSIGPLSAGTSFACLNLPSDVPGSSLSPQCAAIASPSDSKPAQTQALLGKIGKGLEDELSRLSAELNPEFQWTVAKYEDTSLISSMTSSYTQYVIPVPTCVRDSKALLDGHRGWFGGYDSKTEQNVTLRKIAVKMGVNRYLVPDCQLDRYSGVVSASLSYSPDDLSKKGTSQFVLSEADFLGVKHPIFTQSLGPCQKTTP